MKYAAADERKNNSISRGFIVYREERSVRSNVMIEAKPITIETKNPAFFQERGKTPMRWLKNV
jgi:hypothetical protein